MLFVQLVIHGSIKEPFTTRQVVEAVRKSDPEVTLNEATVMGIVGQLGRSGVIVAPRKKMICPISGLPRLAWKRNPRPHKRTRASRRSWQEPDIEQWITNYANVERAFRFAFTEPIPGDIRPGGKFGRQSVYAVQAAILTTLDYERFECYAPAELLAEIAGINKVTAFGALDILEAAGRVARHPYSREYRASCFVDARPGSSQTAIHPFEQQIGTFFRQGQIADVRGTGLLVYLALGYLGGFRFEPIVVKYTEVARIVGVKPVIIRRYTKRLCDAGLLRTKRRGSEGLEIVIVKGLSEGGGDHPPPVTPFLTYLSKWIEARPLVRAGVAESEANAWSCFLAVVFSGDFGGKQRFLSRSQIEACLGASDEGLRHAVRKAVAMELLMPVERVGAKSGMNVLRLCVEDHEGDLHAGSDPVLVLTTLAAWRYGLIREIGLVSHRTQVAMMTMANLTREPFPASGGAIERSYGVASATRSRGIQKLRDHRLVKTVGKGRLATHSLVAPAPNPQNVPWVRACEAIRTAFGSTRLAPTPADTRVSFCNNLARLAKDIARGKVGRPDLRALLYVGHKAGFDPTVAVRLSNHKLRSLKLGSGDGVLERLVATGFLAKEDALSQRDGGTRRRGKAWRLHSPGPPEIPVTATDARRFTDIMDRLVTSGTLARIYACDLLLYILIAAESGFRVAHPVRHSGGGLQKLTGLNLSDISTRLRRLCASGFVQITNKRGKITSVALLDSHGVGTDWTPRVPRQRERALGGRSQLDRPTRDSKERGLAIDEINREARWNGRQLKINTGNDFKILKRLHEAAGDTVEYRELLLVLKPNVVSLDVQLTEAPPEVKDAARHIRTALVAERCTWTIKAVWKHGYRLEIHE